MGFSEWFEKPDPEKECRKWTRQLRREMRRMDREVRGIEREEKKLQKEIRKLAKQGHMGAIKSLARELVASKKAKERLWTCKANMNSVKMQMRSNLSMLKMSKAVKSSTKVMQSMAKLMNVPEVMETMREMSYEMEKAGFIEEMMADTMDDAMGVDEEDVDEEVDKVIMELTMGILDGAQAAPTRAPEKIANSGRDLLRQSLGNEQPSEEESALEKRLAALQA